MKYLFDPVSVGSFKLTNRIVLAPMTRGRAGSGRIPTDLMADIIFSGLPLGY